MKLVIDHLTRYGYDEEVKFSTQYLRLTPRSTGRQKITAWSLTLPDGSAVATTDAWGNVVREVRAGHSALEVRRQYHTLSGRIAEICAGNTTHDCMSAMWLERFW